MVDLQAQVHRVQAASEAASELSEARARLPDYARETEYLKDREAAALKTTERLRHQLG